MKCVDCCYWGTQDPEEHEHCMFNELRGEPSWVDVPPCEQEDCDYEEYEYDEVIPYDE